MVTCTANFPFTTSLMQPILCSSKELTYHLHVWFPISTFHIRISVVAKPLLWTLCLSSTNFVLFLSNAESLLGILFSKLLLKTSSSLQANSYNSASSVRVVFQYFRFQIWSFYNFSLLPLLQYSTKERTLFSDTKIGDSLEDLLHTPLG